MDISIKTTTTSYGVHTGINPGYIRSVSKESKMNTACMEMESMFIQNMFKEMRASIPKSGLISGGKAEEMFTDMLDAEMAKSLSSSGGIGLASMMQRQLEKVQEIVKTNSKE